MHGAPPPISNVLAQGSQQNGGLQRTPTSATGTGGSAGGTPASTSTSPALGAAGSAAHVGRAGATAQRAVVSPAANEGSSARLSDAATHTQALETSTCRDLMRGNSVPRNRNVQLQPLGRSCASCARASSVPMHRTAGLCWNEPRRCVTINTVTVARRCLICANTHVGFRVFERLGLTSTMTIHLGHRRPVPRSARGVRVTVTGTATASQHWHSHCVF